MTAADWGSELLDIWPDNAMAVELFASVRTQWRVGPGGPYGLDYNVVDRRIERLGLDDRQRASLESDLRAMEFAALEELSR